MTMSNNKAFLIKTCKENIKHSRSLIDLIKQTNNMEKIEVLLEMLEEDNLVLSQMFDDLVK